MNNAANPKKFRNAVGGYNKEDVNHYIIETDMANKARTDALQETIDQSQAEIEKLAAEKESLVLENGTLVTRCIETEKSLSDTRETLALREGEQAELEKQLREVQKRLDICLSQTEAQNTVIEKLRSENTSLSARCETLDASLQDAAAKSSEYKEQAENAQAQAEALRAEMERAVAREKELAAAEMERYKASLMEDEDSIAYKLQMYDKLSGQIGDILLGANRNADEILADAKAAAEKIRRETAAEIQASRQQWKEELLKIRSDTESSVIGLRDQLSATASGALESISNDMRLNTDNCAKEISTCVSELEYDLETLLQNLQKRCREVEDRIQYYHSCAQESIAGHIARLDAHRPDILSLGSRE